MHDKFMIRSRLAACVITTLSATLSATLVATLPLTLYAQDAAAPERRSDAVTLNFVNADIPSVVKAIGGPLGKNFIIDPRVTGNMNIVSQAPVSKELAYQILLSALRVHGYAAIEERGVVKIVPEADAKTSGIVLDRGTQMSGDRIVTQIFTLQNESAAQLATVLRPLIAPNNFIGAYPGNNTLVITDYAENVKRIARIIASIDIPASTDVQVIKLQYASAVDVVALLARLMPEVSPNPSNPGAPAKLAVAVEPRTNSLLVRADTPALVTRIKALVAGIDIPTAASGNIHVVYLRNAEATKLAETLRALMGGASSSAPSGPVSGSVAGAPPAAASAVSSTIQAYAPTNSLVITAPDHVYNAMRIVIDKLDTRRAQVFVEALIVEVSTSIASEFGIQWQDLSGISRSGANVIGGTNFGGAGTNIIGAAGNITGVGTGLNIGVVRGTVTIGGLQLLNLTALARALESDQRTNVLSTPNILTLDNEEAKIVVGQNVPFITGSFSQTGTSGSTTTSNPFQTIERKDVGLTLRVTPQVAEGGAVKLKVYQEVSSVVQTTSSVRSADLITNKRSIENTVLVDDGQIVVIGGLIQDDTKNGENKVPFLGDIPFIGNLFKYQTKNRDKTNLMVFLRPYVLRDGKSVNSLTGERYQYIRNEQGNFIEDTNSWVPPTGAALLPPAGTNPGAKAVPLSPAAPSPVTPSPSPSPAPAN